MSEAPILLSDDYGFSARAEDTYLVLDGGVLALLNVNIGEDDICAYARLCSRSRRRLGPVSVRQLIHFLFKHNHWSPFGFAHLTFFVRAPLFVRAQWARHRTGLLQEVSPSFRENEVYESNDERTRQFNCSLEVSGRYVVQEPNFYLPTVDWLNPAPAPNARGRVEKEVVQGAREILRRMRDEQEVLYTNYKWYLNQGLSRELARLNTPSSWYTEFLWQQSLPNLLHFLALRRAPETQREIRAYAEAMEKVVASRFPNLYEAWLDSVNGATFTASELKELRRALAGKILSPQIGKKVLRGEGF